MGYKELDCKKIKRFKGNLLKGNNEFDCWKWGGFIDRDGYGRFKINGRKYLSHRCSYNFFRGLIQKGLVLDHICRNVWCQNPSHLEPVTNRENVLRGVGPSAIHARKKHCPRGHKYKQIKTQRICPTCLSGYQKRYRERVKIF